MVTIDSPGPQVWILASHWSLLITWHEYSPPIGHYSVPRSHSQQMRRTQWLALPTAPTHPRWSPGGSTGSRSPTWSPRWASDEFFHWKFVAMHYFSALQGCCHQMCPTKSSHISKNFNIWRAFSLSTLIQHGSLHFRCFPRWWKSIRNESSSLIHPFSSRCFMEHVPLLHLVNFNTIIQYWCTVIFVFDCPNFPTCCLPGPRTLEDIWTVSG